MYQCHSFQLSNVNNQTRIIIKRRAIIYISLIIVLIIVDMIRMYAGFMYEAKFDPLTWCRKSAFGLFILYPQYIVCAIQSVVFLKYYVYLYELYDKLLDSSNLNLHDIFENYDNLYKSFKRDNHWTLRMSVQMFLVSEILLIWNSLDWFGLTITFIEAVKVLFAFALYFIGASILVEMYAKFEHKLWHFGIKIQNSENRYFYNYTLQYIQKYPIYVEFGSVVVSKQNAIKFLIGIALTKALSYCLQSWIEENY